MWSLGLRLARSQYTNNKIKNPNMYIHCGWEQKTGLPFNLIGFILILRYLFPAAQSTGRRPRPRFTIKTLQCNWLVSKWIKCGRWPRPDLGDEDAIGLQSHGMAIGKWLAIVFFFAVFDGSENKNLNRCDVQRIQISKIRCSSRLMNISCGLGPAPFPNTRSADKLKHARNPIEKGKWCSAFSPIEIGSFWKFSLIDGIAVFKIKFLEAHAEWPPRSINIVFRFFFCL